MTEAGGRIGIVIQARMGSTRLPGKSMMPLAGAPLIQRVVERARKATRPHLVILAIPERAEDDVLIEVATAAGVHLLRGPEHDLLARYHLAAERFGLATVVRIPGDNPCPEPWVIDLTIDHHLRVGDDFTSSYPDVIANGFPDGIGCEVYRASVLALAADEARSLRHREHPHTFFYDHPDRFRIGCPTCPAPLRRPDIVLDVNTAEDFAKLARLYSDLTATGRGFGIDEVIDWWDHRRVTGDAA